MTNTMIVPVLAFGDPGLLDEVMAFDRPLSLAEATLLKRSFQRQP